MKETMKQLASSLFTFFFIFLVVTFGHASTGLSISESVVADPDSELEETILTEDHQKVFGHNLFQGHFKDIKQPGFNKEYVVNIGDTIQIQIWGAIEFSQELTVDSQGNIFLPKVGTVHLLGVKNKDLVKVVENAIHTSYKDMVFCYANISNYQPITVFVSGNVRLPGLYKGMPSDSVLQFIDRARGIDLEHGSFRNIEVRRNGKTAKKFDLYDFLVTGNNELFQFQNGDVIAVNDLMHQITVKGDVKRPYKFEFKQDKIPMDAVLSLAMMKPETTNFTLTRWQRDNQQQLFSGSVKDSKYKYLVAGDTIEFFSDHISKLQRINITGEHDGLETILVDRNATLANVLEHLKFTPRSEPRAVQVFRKSVAAKQKELLNAHLSKLESVILTSSSVTAEESQIRSVENKAYMNFIERARQVEPKGQIVINAQTQYDSIYLEEGDQIYIPAITNLAMVQGEVSIPGTHTYVEGYTVYDYIQLSGGLTERADTKNILVVAQSGTVKQYQSVGETKNAVIQNGDSILVMPKVVGKNIQIAKGITQIMYQIAVSVGVLLAI